MNSQIPSDFIVQGTSFVDPQDTLQVIFYAAGSTIVAECTKIYFLIIIFYCIIESLHVGPDLFKGRV